MLERVWSWGLLFLEKEYQKSVYKKIIDWFYSRLQFKEIPKIEFGSFPRHLVSPYIFVVGFIVFLGLSDHALSYMGTAGVVLGLAGFVIGVNLKGVKRPELPEKYFYPLLVIFCGCMAGIFVDWSLFVKISLLPMLLLFLTGKHTKEVFVIVFLASLVVLRKGFYGIALPYTFFSLIFLATVVRGSVFDDHIKGLAFTFLVVGGLFWVLDVLLFHGFPLLTPEARGILDPTFTMLSHLLPIGCVMSIVILKNRTASVVLVFVSVVLMALLGYRTQVVLVMLASCFAAFLMNVISGLETVSVLGGTGVMGLVLTGFRDVLLQTRIGIIEAVRTRVSLTLDIYDMMANIGGFTGFTKGQVYVAAVPRLAQLMPKYAYSPRRYIAEMVGMDVSATSTILGPLAVDFGLIGMCLGMVFLGYLLARLYEKKRLLGVSLYCIVLAYSLIGIETGIVDLEVLVIFFLSFLYVLRLE
jgi:oligosaccharide repeat unit polymerase